MKFKLFTTLFGLGLFAASANAAVILSLDSVTSNGGDGYLQLSLTNSLGSSPITVAGFSFGVSAPGGSGVTFGFPGFPSTVADTTTSATYIFAGNSLFGPDISLSGFGTSSAAGSDLFDTISSGRVVNANETYGLARIYFNLAGGAPVNPILISIDKSIALTSLSDDAAGAIAIDSFVDGTISAPPVTAPVPEPSTFLLLGGGLLAAGLRRWKSRQ